MKQSKKYFRSKKEERASISIKTKAFPPNTPIDITINPNDNNNSAKMEQTETEGHNMEESLGFYRDTWAEVNLNAIQNNVVNLKKHLPDEVGIMAIVKANGYGHGAEDVAKTALEAGAGSLGVAILDEALELRDKGITAPLLVMGYVKPEYAALAAERNITLTVFQKEWVEKAVSCLESRTGQLKCHIKVDTGMGRLGIRTREEGKALINSLEKYDHIYIEGIYTHFATADETDSEYFQQQQKRFEEMLSFFEKELGSDIPVKHCGNSATALRFADRCFNMVRFGISMYGLSPSEEITPLLPFELDEAFSLHSSITHVKQLPEGEGISYGATYKTKEDEIVGTIPIGYADGWIRKNSPGSVLVNGERVPVIGRICMDQMMVSLKTPVETGTKVTLIGRQGHEYIPVSEVAARLETINYEIPCMITSRVPRVIMKDDEVKRVIKV